MNLQTVIRLAGPLFFAKLLRVTDPRSVFGLGHCPNFGFSFTTTILLAKQPF